MIANCSPLRPPTEMFLYFLESWGQCLSIEYKIISVSGLWAEQFAKVSSGFPNQHIFGLAIWIVYPIFSLCAGLQTTHRNDFVLFEILRTMPFHRELNNFCRWSLSRAIHKLRSGLRMSLNLKNNEFHHNKKHINWGAARFYYTFLGPALSIFSYGR